MCEEVEILAGLLNDIGLYHLSQECVYSLFLQDELLVDESLLNCINLIQSTPNCLEIIIKLLKIIRDKNTYQELWNLVHVIADRAEDGKLFVPLVKYIFNNMSSQKYRASQIYILVLSISKFQNVFHQEIFSKILKQIVDVKQLLDTKKQLLNIDTEKIISVSDILVDMKYIMHKQFIETATPQMYSAVLELALKLSSSFRKDITKKGGGLLETSWELSKITAAVNIDISLPVIVSTLINETSKTNAANEWRDRLCLFVATSLRGHDDSLILFLKHILIRGAERTVMREVTSSCVKAIAPALSNSKPLVDFLLTLSRAKVIGLRAQAAMTASKTVYLHEMQNLALASASILYSLMEDSKGPVSSAAIIGISQLVQSIDTIENSESIKIRIGLAQTQIFPHSENCKEDDNNEYQSIITKTRKTMRALNFQVRKAGLSLAERLLEKGIIQILDAISERTRDTAMSIRIEAAAVLSRYLKREKSVVALKTWLEAIVTSYTGDAKAEENSFQLFEEYVINAKLIYPLHKAFSLSLELVLTDFIRRFSVHHSITPICQQIYQNIKKDSSIELWMLLKIIIERQGGTNSKIFAELWSERFNLPYYYLEIISLLRSIPERFFADVFEDLKNTKRNFSTLKGLISIASKTERKGIFKILGKKSKKNIKKYIKENLKYESIDRDIYVLGEYFSKNNELAKSSYKLLIKLLLNTYPVRVRTSSVLAITKAALSSRDLAFDVVKIIGSLITTNEDSRVVMNAITSLSDICICYTAIGDQYLPAVLKNIIAPNVEVRKHSLIVITRLLSEEYLRMKPVHFFCLMVATVDPDEGVSGLAETCLFGVVVRRSGRLSSYVADSLYYFNGYYQKLGIEDRTGFAVADLERRRRMYGIAIDHLSDVEVVELVMSVSSRVLEELADAKLSVDADSGLIRDGILVMTLLQEKIKYATSAPTEPLDDTTMQARGKAVSFVRAQLTRRVLPFVVMARERLRAARSPLQGDAGDLLSDMVANCPGLLDEVRAADPALSSELEAVVVREAKAAQEEGPSAPISPSRRRAFGSRMLRELQRRSVSMDSVAEPGQKQPPSDGEESA